VLNQLPGRSGGEECSGYFQIAKARQFSNSPQTYSIETTGVHQAVFYFKDTWKAVFPAFVGGGAVLS
jgi:hypothetical protein